MWRGQLAASFLFEGLELDDLTIVVDAMAPVAYGSGAVVFKQGDAGDLFYIVHSGTVNVLLNGEVVSSLATGSHFGELALMFNTARLVSVSVIYVGVRVGEHPHHWHGTLPASVAHTFSR